MPEAVTDALVLARLGAVLETPRKGAEEPIEARGFRHPALGERVIVRLAPAALREAEALAMNVLGCVPVSEARVVGAGVRRAVGFPAAVIVADPDNARHALDVMRDLEAAARRARSKPGHAKDAIDAIGKRLARTVPHFLPSFYEEAARRFAALGLQSQAATCFGKAREAERVHAVALDPAARREAFLELALSGALTSSVLADYAKDLEQGSDAAAAHDELFALAVRAVSGGMPPWASLVKDLRRLAKRAGRDAEHEEVRLLRELIGAPALAHASHAFWDDARASVVRLGREDAAVRLRLAATWPNVQHKNDAFAWWVTLLVEAGVVDELEAGEAPLGSWVEKLLAHVNVGWSGVSAPDAALALVRRLAPRLVRDAVPVRLAKKGHWVDPDLLDLALELGVPIVVPTPPQRLALSNWGSPRTALRGPGASAAPSTERPRQLASLATDPRVRSLLEASVEESMGNVGFDALTDERAALRAVRDEVVRKRLASLEQGGLPGLETTRAWLEKKTRPATFATLPEERQRLRSLDLATLLAATLRGGLIDELGWPELDRAAAELHAEDGNTWPLLLGAFPHPILVGRRRTIVLGASGRVKEIAIQLPGAARAALYSRGEVMFVVDDPKHSWKRSCLWSSDRTGRDTQWWHRALESVVELEGTAVLGGRFLVPGSLPSHDMQLMASDGVTVWRLEWERQGTTRLQHWVELDPRTETKGRVSSPRFFEEGSEGGGRLEAAMSSLWPAPGLTRSPLGLRDGLVGVCTRSRDGVFETRRIDGVVVRGARPALGMLELPGTEARRTIVRSSTHAQQDPSLLLLDDGVRELSRLGTSGEARPYTRGTELPLPLAFLHFTSARDEPASACLRAFDAARAATLLERSRGIEELEATEKAIASALPEVGDRVVLRAIAGVTLRANQLRLALVALHEAAPDVALAGPEIEAAPIGQLLLMLDQPFESPRDQKVSDEVRAYAQSVRAFLAGEAVDEGARKGGSVAWEGALACPEAFVLQSMLAGWGDTHRRAASGLVELLASEGLLGLAHARLLQGTFVMDKLPKPMALTCATFTSGQSLYLVRRNWQGGRVLEVSRSGTFVAPAWLEVKSETAVPRHDEARVRAVGARVVKGAWAFEARHASTLAERTGMTRPEAAAWLLGLSSVVLTKEQRERFDVKAKEADRAAATLVATRRPTLRRVLGALAAEVPETVDDVVARFAELLAAELGPTVTVDEELASALTKDLGHAVAQAPSATLRWILEGAQGAQLSKRPRPFLDPRTRANEQAFNEATVRHLALYLAYLAIELPAGHAMNAALAGAFEAAKRMLADPELTLPLGFQHAGYEAGKSADELTSAALTRLGGTPFERDQVHGRDLGAYVAGAVRGTWGISLELRPARVHEEPALLDKLATSAATLEPVRFLVSEACVRMVARLVDPTRTPGTFDASLAVSAPDVVADIAKTYGLSPEAALLYAETLAHACPTDAKLRAWNGWSAKVLEKAREELAGKGLVEIAKRERSGRSHFLPCPWESFHAPLRPIEAFKLPFFATKAVMGWSFPLGVQVPRVPFAEHARVIWEHAKKEPPRFEEIAR
ncbi:MAG: hypothetical protein K1X94_20565 [Sandaracinaceae bacterium]|nr:hypothetical protein [Sandaracinaceae bacterium]